jgi:hypothetical protein
MRGPIYRYLADDHVRLDTLLRKATAVPDRIDPEPYGAFRAGLLKHIAMEEKVLLPEAARLRGGEALPIAAKLRVDHGAIAALLVATPTPGIVAALTVVLGEHNKIEEGPGGLYETCDELAGPAADAIVEKLKHVSEVRVSAYSDGPRVTEATSRALARAGFDFKPEDLKE